MFLGISVLLFIVIFGFLFQVGTVVLASIYTLVDQTFESMGITGSWAVMFVEVQSLSQLLIPLIMSLGIVILVLKVLMASGALGRD